MVHQVLLGQVVSGKIREMLGTRLAVSAFVALLATAYAQGAREAYLQVGCDNDAAQQLYRKLGFTWAYRYHYRSPTDLVD